MISWSILPVFGSPIWPKIALLEKSIQSMNNITGLHLANWERMVELCALSGHTSALSIAHRRGNFTSPDRMLHEADLRAFASLNLCQDWPPEQWLSLTPYTCLTKSTRLVIFFQSQKDDRQEKFLLLLLKGHKLLIIFIVAVSSVISAISDSEVLSFRLKAQWKI